MSNRKICAIDLTYQPTGGSLEQIKQIIKNVDVFSFDKVIFYISKDHLHLFETIGNDNELVALMKKGGIAKVEFGLERLDPESLKQIKKSLGKRYRKNINIIEKNVGMEIKAAFDFAKKSKLPDKKLLNKLYLEIGKN